MALRDHHSSHLRPRGKAVFFPHFMGEETRLEAAHKLRSFLDAKGLYPISNMFISLLPVSPIVVYTRGWRLHASYRKSDDKDWDSCHWPSICSWDLVRELGTLPFVHRLSALFYVSQGRTCQKCSCVQGRPLSPSCLSHWLVWLSLWDFGTWCHLLSPRLSLISRNDMESCVYIFQIFILKI